MNPLEIVGAITLALILAGVGLVAAAMIGEARRSFRQTCRIFRVDLGVDWRRSVWQHRKAFLRIWRRDYLHSYTDLVVRGMVLPHDARSPIRRRYYG